MGTKSQNAAKILVLLLVLCGMRGDEGEGGRYNYVVGGEIMIQLLLSQIQADFSPLEWEYHQLDCTSTGCHNCSVCVPSYCSLVARRRSTCV